MHKAFENEELFDNKNLKTEYTNALSVLKIRSERKRQSVHIDFNQALNEGYVKDMLKFIRKEHLTKCLILDILKNREED